MYVDIILVCFYYIINCNYKICFACYLFIILTGLFILLTIHYYKCIKLLKNNNFLEEKKVIKLKNTNSVLAFIFGFMSFTMLSVAIYPMIVLGGWIDFCLYFIIVGVLCGFYTINLLMNNKNNM